MKKLIIMAFAISTILSGCDSWVDKAETPSNTLTYDELKRPSMIATLQSKNISDGPMVAFVKTLQGEAAAQMFLALGTTVDELTEGTIPNALLYRHISSDNITPSSGTQNDLWNRLQNYYARSIEVLNVANELPDNNTKATNLSKAYGGYIGNLHAGYALQLLAECFSTTPNAEGGSIRLNNALVSHQSLLTMAQEHFNKALEFVQMQAIKDASNFDYNVAVRQINTYKLRLAMHQQRYSDAATLVSLAINDAEQVEVIYNNDGSDNPLYAAIGPNARDIQVSADLEAVRFTAAEQKALPLKHVSVDKKNPNRYNIYASALTRKGALVIADAADIHFIKAELIVRGMLSGNALEEVNKVITKYNAADAETASLTLERIATLRRIYLALRGERTADVRRGLEQGSAATMWKQRKIKWLPLPEKELENLP